MLLHALAAHLYLGWAAALRNPNVFMQARVQPASPEAGPNSLGPGFGANLTSEAGIAQLKPRKVLAPIMPVLGNAFAPLLSELVAVTEVKRNCWKTSFATKSLQNVCCSAREAWLERPKVDISPFCGG